MEKLEKGILIILTSFLLMIIIGIIIFYIFDLNKYGIRLLCSSIGGIWCYWPSWFGVFFTLIVIIAIILIILILFLKIKKRK